MTSRLRYTKHTLTLSRLIVSLTGLQNILVTADFKGKVGCMLLPGGADEWSVCWQVCDFGFSIGSESPARLETCAGTEEFMAPGTPLTVTQPSQGNWLMRMSLFKFTHPTQNDDDNCSPVCAGGCEWSAD